MPKLYEYFDLRVGRRRSEYIRCFIFRTKAAMREFHAQQLSVRDGCFAPLPNPLKFEALASSWTAYRLTPSRLGTARTRRWRRSPRRGQVLFHREFFGAGVVAHEMTHMALYLTAPRRGSGFVLSAADDERLAAMAGELVRKFWCAWWKLRAKRSRAGGGAARA